MKTRPIGLFIILAAVIALLIILISAAWSVWWARPDLESDPIAFEILPGTAGVDIIDQLEELELLDAPFWFRVYGKLTGGAANIHAGMFEIRPNMSVSELFALLADADVAEKEVTIIEGWTLKDIEAHLVARDIGTAGDMNRLSFDAEFKADYPFLAEIPGGYDIEGYVFPETYRVFADASSDDVLRKALDTFDYRVVRGLASELASSEYSLFEIVTIASMLEREVQTADDMMMVSDLIRRRLEIGMPLQFDSTVNYVTGKDDPGISLVDRDVESPYNTYKYGGLQVGPISNPSEQAIKAALNPTPNDYLYFLTTPEGEVIYSRTNEEHAGNKARYLR